MKVEFKSINTAEHFQHCVDFRRDAYVCSFGTEEGFESFVEGYRQRMENRFSNEKWFYRHIWFGSELVGQLEFKTYSSLPEMGYVHLLYVTEEYRGSGIATLAQAFIESCLRKSGCEGAMLSVSRSNHRAISHYKKTGWKFHSPNKKHPLTDFYIRKF